jgi:hypothetical protein
MLSENIHVIGKDIINEAADTNLYTVQGKYMDESGNSGVNILADIDRLPVF